MQEPPASPSPSRPDRGAASFGLIVGTLISYFSSRIPESADWKPVAVMLGPAIGISLSLAWAWFKVAVLTFFREESELADIQRSQYSLSKRLEIESDSEMRAVLETELYLAKRDETDLVLRRVRRRRRERQARQ